MDQEKRELSLAFSALLLEPDVHEKALRDDELFSRLVRVGADEYGVTEQVLMTLLHRITPHFLEGWKDGVALPDDEYRSYVLRAMSKILTDNSAAPKAA